MAKEKTGPAETPETMKTKAEATEPQPATNTAEAAPDAGPKPLPFDIAKLERPMAREGTKGKVWDVLPGDPEECRKRDEWLATLPGAERHPEAKAIVGGARFVQDTDKAQAHYPDPRTKAVAAVPAWDGPKDAACYIGYPFAAWHTVVGSLGGVALLKVGLAPNLACAVYVRADAWRAA